jgi:hypothetical protein
LKQQKHAHEANKTSTARRGREKIRQFNNLNKQDNRGAHKKDSLISKWTICKLSSRREKKKEEEKEKKPTELAERFPRHR